MPRLSYLVALVALFGLVQTVSAAETPVPRGFHLPNIFNPVLDRADGRHQAKLLVNLVAKEPRVAFGVGFEKEAPIEDTWNGESDPESSASVAQKHMLKEVESLTKLIRQGKKILRMLPRKQMRLKLLKGKLAHILEAKAKREAGEQLAQQEAILNAIRKREGALSSRLNKLKSSQNKLSSSVKRLKKVLKGKPKAKKLSRRRHHGRRVNKRRNLRRRRVAKKHNKRRNIRRRGAKKLNKRHGAKKLNKKRVVRKAAKKPAAKSLLEAEAETETQAEAETETETEAQVDAEVDAAADLE